MPNPLYTEICDRLTRSPGDIAIIDSGEEVSNGALQQAAESCRKTTGKFTGYVVDNPYGIPRHAAPEEYVDMIRPTGQFVDGKIVTVDNSSFLLKP